MKPWIAALALADEEPELAGAVLKHSRDFNLTREAVLSSALHPATPAYDVQQACATSLTASVQLSNRIRVGQLDVAVAGGVDSASDSPVAVSDRLRKALVRHGRGRADLFLYQPRPGYLAALPHFTRESDGPEVEVPLSGLRWEVAL